jgi:hypothetical protein
MTNYEIKDIYQSSSSFFKDNPNNSNNYKTNFRTFGLTSDPRTANIIKDVSQKLNTGVKHIEISAVTPEIFESVPNEQLKEIKRLSELTGVDISLHGPIVEPSGISQGGYSESSRLASERQMLSSIERAHELKPNGNIVVTFHSSASIPGIIPDKDKNPEEGFVINTETGSIGRIPIKKHNFPGESSEISVREELKKINEEQWNEKLRVLNHYSGVAEDAILNSLKDKFVSDKELKDKKELIPYEQEKRKEYNRGIGLLNSCYIDLKNAFELAYEKASNVEKEKIKDFYKEIEKDAQEINKNPNDVENILKRKEIIDKGIEFLNNQISFPEIYSDLNEFAKNKTVETISNLAVESFKKFKDKSPIISIENPPVGLGISTGEELKELVEKSREKFIEKLKQSGMNEKKAKETAEKLIGVTWDVGHINMMRKYGYESKDIIKETEKIAPLVKHVHLSDNFGFEHTELPMGMGNVPIKEIMEKLGKEGFDAKKIIEAGNWWQHFQRSPLKETVNYFNSPIDYSGNAPYWNQSLGFQQNYYSGYGAFLPQKNYEIFGGGFSGLPSELGGQLKTGESRFSGNPLE